MNFEEKIDHIIMDLIPEDDDLPKVEEFYYNELMIDKILKNESFIERVKKGEISSVIEEIRGERLERELLINGSQLKTMKDRRILSIWELKQYIDNLISENPFCITYTVQIPYTLKDLKVGYKRVDTVACNGEKLLFYTDGTLIDYK